MMFRSKLPNVGTTIFTVMTGLANETGAINLSQGYPDFSCNPQLIDLVEQNMRKGHNQYAPMQGLMALREIIAEKTLELYSHNCDPVDEITVTAGAIQAIFTAITAFVQEDDEVIIFEPAYDCYVPAIELNGGVPIYIQLKSPDFRIEWKEVEKLVTSKTRMIILNSPHNPTGSTLSAADLEKLKKIVSGTKILILSDEVYEHIIFDGLEHQSLLRYPKLAERSLIVSSFGKTFHITGWKTGYCIAPRQLMAEFRKVHQFNVFCVNTPVQHALAEFLKRKDEYLALGSFYQQKRDYFNNAMKNTRFGIRPSKGTYFQLLDYSKITDEKERDFAIRLTREFGVAAIPVSVFYHKDTENKVLRFCFAKSEETIDKAAEKLMKL